MGWEVMEGLRFLASLPLAGTLGRGKEARKRNLSIASNLVSVHVLVQDACVKLCFWNPSNILEVCTHCSTFHDKSSLLTTLV